MLATSSTCALSNALTAQVEKSKATVKIYQLSVSNLVTLQTCVSLLFKTFPPLPPLKPIPTGEKEQETQNGAGSDENSGDENTAAEALSHRDECTLLSVSTSSPTVSLSEITSAPLQPWVAASLAVLEVEHAALSFARRTGPAIVYRLAANNLQQLLLPSFQSTEATEALAAIRRVRREEARARDPITYAESLVKKRKLKREREEKLIVDRVVREMLRLSHPHLARASPSSSSVAAELTAAKGRVTSVDDNDEGGEEEEEDDGGAFTLRDFSFLSQQVTGRRGGGGAAPRTHATTTFRDPTTAVLPPCRDVDDDQDDIDDDDDDAAAEVISPPPPPAPPLALPLTYVHVSECPTLRSLEGLQHCPKLEAIRILGAAIRTTDALVGVLPPPYSIGAITGTAGVPLQQPQGEGGVCCPLLMSVQIQLNRGGPPSLRGLDGRTALQHVSVGGREEPTTDDDDDTTNNNTNDNIHNNDNANNNISSNKNNSVNDSARNNHHDGLLAPLRFSTRLDEVSCTHTRTLRSLEPMFSTAATTVTTTTGYDDSTPIASSFGHCWRFEHITSLDFRATALRDVEALRGCCPQLRSLTLSACRDLTHLGGLEDKRELTLLYVNQCPKLTSVAALAGGIPAPVAGGSNKGDEKSNEEESDDNQHSPHALRVFSANGCPALASLEGLQDKPHLQQVLIADCTQISTLLPYALEWPSLGKLVVRGCTGLTTGLAGLEGPASKTLREVVADGAPVASLLPLRRCRMLRLLTLLRNPAAAALHSLDGLQDKPLLTTLEIGGVGGGVGGLNEDDNYAANGTAMRVKTRGNNKTNMNNNTTTDTTTAALRDLAPLATSPRLRRLVIKGAAFTRGLVSLDGLQHKPHLQDLLIHHAVGLTTLEPYCRHWPLLRGLSLDGCSNLRTLADLDDSEEDETSAMKTAGRTQQQQRQQQQPQNTTTTTDKSKRRDQRLAPPPPPPFRNLRFFCAEDAPLTSLRALRHSTLLRTIANNGNPILTTLDGLQGKANTLQHVAFKGATNLKSIAALADAEALETVEITQSLALESIAPGLERNNHAHNRLRLVSLRECCHVRSLSPLADVSNSNTCTSSGSGRTRTNKGNSNSTSKSNYSNNSTSKSSSPLQTLDVRGCVMLCPAAFSSTGVSSSASTTADGAGGRTTKASSKQRQDDETLRASRIATCGLGKVAAAALLPLDTIAAAMNIDVDDSDDRNNNDDNQASKKTMSLSDQLAYNGRLFRYFCDKMGKMGDHLHNGHGKRNTQKMKDIKKKKEEKEKDGEEEEEEEEHSDAKWAIHSAQRSPLPTAANDFPLTAACSSTSPATLILPSDVLEQIKYLRTRPYLLETSSSNSSSSSSSDVDDDDDDTQQQQQRKGVDHTKKTALPPPPMFAFSFTQTPRNEDSGIAMAPVQRSENDSVSSPPQPTDTTTATITEPTAMANNTDKEKKAFCPSPLQQQQKFSFNFAPAPVPPPQLQQQQKTSSSETSKTFSFSW